jgi:hypothetical protein
MPGLDKFDLASGPTKGAENAVDAVAWVAKNLTHAQAWSRETRKSPTV